MTTERKRPRKLIYVLFALVAIVIGGKVGYDALQGPEAAAGEQKPSVSKPAEQDGSETADLTVETADEGAEEGTALEDTAEAKERVKGTQKDESKDPVYIVDVAEARLGSIARYLLSTSSLRAEREIDIVSKIPGLVSEILVEEGDWVKAGQALLRLDAEEAGLKLRQAEVKLKNQQAEVGRARQAIQDRLIPQQDLDRLIQTERELQVARDLAVYELENTVISAPFGGRILERKVHKGQYIQGATPLFLIADMSLLLAEVFFPEADVNALEIGQEAEVILASDDTVRSEGLLKRISPYVDRATGTSKVTLELSTRDQAFKPGSFVKVRIKTQLHQDAVLVPRKALVEDQDEMFCFVATTDDKVKKLKVSTGFSNDQDVEIISGVQPGDRVVVLGKNKLKDGSRIKVLSG